MARSRSEGRMALRLIYIDFWSCLKLSFLVSLAVAAVTIVVALVGWSLLEKTGLIATARSLFTDIGGSGATDLFAGLTFQGVLGFTLVVALLELIVVTALGAVFAALFNLAARMTGGARMDFGKD